jgi:hypothetical protein
MKILEIFLENQQKKGIELNYFTEIFFMSRKTIDNAMKGLSWLKIVEMKQIKAKSGRGRPMNYWRLTNKPFAITILTALDFLNTSRYGLDWRKTYDQPTKER